MKLAVIVIPVCVGVSLCNYLADPAKVFTSRKYVAGIAQILSSGHNVGNISNYNERLLQEQMILRLHKTPDIIILGSSRIMEIGSEFFPGKYVLNCGVSHANIHDLISLTGLLDSMERLPLDIYMNVDAGLLSKETTEWQSLSDYYQYFFRDQDIYNKDFIRVDKSIQESKLFALFSFSYFRESVNFMMSGRSNRYVDVGIQRPVYGRFSDATISYPSVYLNPDTIKVASDARNTGREGIFSYPSEVEKNLLHTLVGYLKKRKVRIHFIMLPYHPEFYQAVNETQANLLVKYESYFRNLADKENIPVTGSLNPYVLHMNQKEFYDMYHCSKESIKRIFKNGS